MNFFPRELCERLAELGCKSESEMSWVFTFRLSTSTKKKWFITKTTTDPWFLKENKYVTAFYQNDFTGCHDQAWENVKKLRVGRICGLCGEVLKPRLCARSIGNAQFCAPLTQRNFRIQMLDSNNPAKYIEEFLDGNNNNE